MTPVNTYQDAIPFAGKVVAFHATSAMFNAAFLTMNGAFFGYVETELRDWDSFNKGHTLTAFIATSMYTQSHGRALIDCFLKKDQLQMRFATATEVGAL